MFLALNVRVLINWAVYLAALSQGKGIYLFSVLRYIQHCTDHITMGTWKSRGNQYIQLVKVVYCKLTSNGKQLAAFPLEFRLGFEL